MKTVVLQLLSNLKDKKTTVAGAAFLLAAAMSFGWISQEQLNTFVANFNSILLLLAGVFLTGFVGGSAPSSTQSSDAETIVKKIFEANKEENKNA